MFKKKEKTEKAPKNKKVRIMKVGTHKKSVLLLWAVLLASTSFGVYKNFTAIDTHTVHEKEIIQLRLNDTNGISGMVHLIISSINPHMGNIVTGIVSGMEKYQIASLCL